MEQSFESLLQQKIGSKSAGRVQSAVLKLIVDREREIEAFDKQEYWDLFAYFNYLYNDHEYNLKAKVLRRKKGHMVYIKESEKISDLLKMIKNQY